MVGKEESTFVGVESGLRFGFGDSKSMSYLLSLFLLMFSVAFFYSSIIRASTVFTPFS